MKLRQLVCPEHIKNGRAFEGKNGIIIIASVDKHPDFGEILHVSISKENEYPTWSDIIETKLHFFGDRKDVMMVIPKREDYVNIHNNCFHLWECPQDWNMR